MTWGVLTGGKTWAKLCDKPGRKLLHYFMFFQGR